MFLLFLYRAAFWDGTVTWEEIGQPSYNNLRSINEVLRNSVLIPAESFYEGGFIDLLDVHNIYIHSPNLGHYNSIGARGERTLINKSLYHRVWDI